MVDRGWTFLRSTPLHTRGRLTLREDHWQLPGGREQIYPVLAVGVTVGVVPYVDAERIILVRQFRHLTRADSWELPGGGALADESPESAAQRELQEEAGYRCDRLTFLCRFFPSNAYLDETAYCYLAEGLVADPLPADHDEFFERAVVSFADAVRMALDDRITESVSKVAILTAALKRGIAQ
jgi:8-oxo-dGTP pyrophosphatase MutT (NUDIX family)